MAADKRSFAERLAKRVARRVVDAWQRRKLRASASPWLSGRTGPVLIVAPHQDDETLGCGGLIVRRIREGNTVVVVFLTNGAASHPDHPHITPEALSLTRKEEARRACAILGVPSPRLHFLDAPDGRLPHLPADSKNGLVSRLAALIAETNAIELFVTASADGSTEHAAAHALTLEALSILPAGIPRPALFEYPVWSRWNPLLLGPQLRGAKRIHCLTLSPEEQAAKWNALQAYRSQIDSLHPHPPVLSSEFLGYFRGSEEFFFQH